MSEWEEQDDNIEADTDMLEDVDGVADEQATDIEAEADMLDDTDVVDFETSDSDDDKDYPPHKPEYPSFLQMIRRFFFQTAGEKQSERHQRLTDLNRAIQSNPDVAANYMLRGELRLEKKDYELARDDFIQAIDLATTQLDNEKWGIAAQSIMDRAHEGLQQTLRYLD